MLIRFFESIAAAVVIGCIAALIVKHLGDVASDALRQVVG